MVPEATDDIEDMTEIVPGAAPVLPATSGVPLTLPVLLGVLLTAQGVLYRKRRNRE